MRSFIKFYIMWIYIQETYILNKNWNFLILAKKIFYLNIYLNFIVSIVSSNFKISQYKQSVKI